METINACFRSDDPEGRIMSNFSQHPFIIDGVHCKTVEGFLQGIKFPPDDPRREQTFVMTGVKAWRMREHAQGEYVWWNGETITYRSEKHAGLLERAIREKFAQNSDAMQALLSTQGLTIIHEPDGPPESPNTSLPASTYCKILTDIRNENSD